MKRHSLNQFLMIFCTFCLSVGSQVLANEVENEKISFPEVVRIELEGGEEENVEKVNPLTDSIWWGNAHSDQYYLRRIHQDGFYHLVAFSDNGDIVQLHDNSQWLVEKCKWHQVLSWVQSDEIFIKPNISWTSNKYVLHNRTVNQTVEVSLMTPPSYMGANTFRIINIQPYERLVLLSDNTVWQVGPDFNFSNWKIGQSLIVGVNNQWRTATYPQILINVDLFGEPYSPATFYGYPL